MIHEIYPKEYKVPYINCIPEPGDTILLFNGDNICCYLENDEIIYPRFSAFPVIEGVEGKFIYLFSIDEERFFMPDKRCHINYKTPEGFQWHPVNSFFRTAGPQHLAFAAVTAQELYEWYLSSEYCGKCGSVMSHSETERARICNECNLIIYPRISPVVIVGVTHGDKLLVTRYKNRPYRQYALVAGYMEIGESFEDTVHREVFEETGVHVKNIKYYKSQPWGLSSTILAGFFCQLDGDPTIRLDEEELSEAIWLPRQDIPAATANVSLTSEMMEIFRTGEMV